MQAKFTIVSSEMVGIGVWRTMYETNIEVASNPSFITLLEQMKEGIWRELGINSDTAVKDASYSMRLAILQQSPLGVKVPGGKYTLIITESNSITRLPVEFRLQGIGG